MKSISVKNKKQEMNSTHIPSIFNDVIGPVMRGPSSSHTAAAHRIGSMIRHAVEAKFSKIIVEFDKTSALATTYIGQGSALGLAGGLLGIEMIDPEIIDYEKHLENSNFTIEYIITDIENKHPNAYQITVQYPGGEDISVLAVSTGGGAIEIIEWGGLEVSMKGDLYETLLIFEDEDSESISRIEHSLNNNLHDFKLYKSIGADNKLLLNIQSAKSLNEEIDSISNKFGIAFQKYEFIPVMSVPSALHPKLPFRTLDEMLQLASDKNLSLSELALSYESARTGLSADIIVNKMKDIVYIIQASILEGLIGTSYQDRLLGAQSPLIEKGIQDGLFERSINTTIIAYTSALMEMKSSMGLIVAAPTAGSCGVLGGTLFASIQTKKFDLDAMVKAFLAAGITGVFIAGKYTFSAEEGGCQVEAGAGSAMAAAGLVELAGGSAKQAIDAASMALQNLLGMICDPVAVRVELPCLGKNILGATNAYNSYIMAMAGYDAVIPFDEVIDAMKSVGEALPSSLCCTGLGGLAQTAKAKFLFKKMNKAH